MPTARGLDSGELARERSDRIFFRFVNLEKVEQSDHFQCLNRVVLRLHKFDTASTLPGAGVAAHQYADTAGIDHRNFSEVYEESDVAVLQTLFESQTERVNGLPEGEPASKTKDLNVRLPQNRKIHRVSPRCNEPLRALTLKYRSDTVPPKVAKIISDCKHLHPHRVLGSEG